MLKNITLQNRNIPVNMGIEALLAGIRNNRNIHIKYHRANYGPSL
jgi:hypothetical protein